MGRREHSLCVFRRLQTSRLLSRGRWRLGERQVFDATDAGRVSSLALAPICVIRVGGWRCESPCIGPPPFLSIPPYDPRRLVVVPFRYSLHFFTLM